MNSSKPIKLAVHHPVPSLNKLFAMNPWARKREKVKTQKAFHAAMLESSAIEGDYSTLIILREAASIFWIAVHSAGLSATTTRRRSRSKSAKSK